MCALRLGAVGLTALLMATPAFAQLEKDDVEDLNEAATWYSGRSGMSLTKGFLRRSGRKPNAWW